MKNDTHDGQKGWDTLARSSGAAGAKGRGRRAFPVVPAIPPNVRLPAAEAKCSMELSATAAFLVGGLAGFLGIGGDPLLM